MSRCAAAGCGWSAGDSVVADEEGVVVTPREDWEQVLLDARRKLAKEAEESLDAWERGAPRPHRHDSSATAASRAERHRG